MELNKKPDPFVYGQEEIGAEALNQILRAVPRVITGDLKYIQVGRFGDRITLRFRPENLPALSNLNAFIIIQEFPDYLSCLPFSYLEVGIQPYEPDYVSTHNLAELVYVAKPRLLQRMPFDKTTVTLSDRNETYTYLPTGKRRVKFTARAMVVSIANSGNSYAVGDAIILAGGVFNFPVVLTVTGVDLSGAILGFVLATPGSYTAIPSNPVEQFSTSGAGGGATFNVIWSPIPIPPDVVQEITTPYYPGDIIIGWRGETGLSVGLTFANDLDDPTATIPCPVTFEDVNEGGRSWVVADADRFHAEVTQQASITNEQILRLERATSGIFTLTYNGRTTANITYSTNPVQLATQIQADLRALSADTASADAVKAGNDGTEYIIHLKSAVTPQPLMTVNGIALIGNCPSATVTFAPAAFAWRELTSAQNGILTPLELGRFGIIGNQIYNPGYIVTNTKQYPIPIQVGTVVLIEDTGLPVDGPDTLLLTVNATGGTFAFTYYVQTTDPPLPYNASASDIEMALRDIGITDAIVSDAGCGRFVISSFTLPLVSVLLLDVTNLLGIGLLTLSTEWRGFQGGSAAVATACKDFSSMILSNMIVQSTAPRSIQFYTANLTSTGGCVAISAPTLQSTIPINCSPCCPSLPSTICGSIIYSTDPNYTVGTLFEINAYQIDAGSGNLLINPVWLGSVPVVPGADFTILGIGGPVCAAAIYLSSLPKYSNSTLMINDILAGVLVPESSAAFAPINCVVFDSGDIPLTTPQGIIKVRLTKC